MGQVLVRNLDDQVIEAIKLKAELKGHSLEQELREIIRQAAPLLPEERLALSDRIRAMQKAPSTLRSEDVLREDRESR